ncbi:hypothetical protein L1987_63165 [Smallanthus sonchifolius]|uniref:Uncharacterized protein n=1 Tax=Smallanthus sonchifolius TaxID=185202 RepID=A0ACB9CCE3_9ASTR|nr:hypothetical protein L1987_63165 [Smallanthus sonchifolius]
MACVPDQDHLGQLAFEPTRRFFSLLGLRSTPILVLFLRFLSLQRAILTNYPAKSPIRHLNRVGDPLNKTV